MKTKQGEQVFRLLVDGTMSQEGKPKRERQLFQALLCLTPPGNPLAAHAQRQLAQMREGLEPR